MNTPTLMKLQIIALLFLTSCFDQVKECHTYQGEIEVEAGANSDIYEYDSIIESGSRTRLYVYGDSIDFKTSEVVGISYKSIQECEIVNK